MWWLRRMENIRWTACATNEEVLHRAKEERNILHIIKKRKATWMVKSCVKTVFQNTLLKARQREG
jgi:hypothetical protein